MYISAFHLTFLDYPKISDYRWIIQVPVLLDKVKTAFFIEPKTYLKKKENKD